MVSNAFRMSSLHTKRTGTAVRNYFDTLFTTWGPQHWWPAESPFEVIVGAFLTQNTSWKNVERAMANLRDQGLLSIDGIRRLELCEVEQLIRPAGYFRQKAARLKNFVSHLDRLYGGSLERMFARPTGELRTELLLLNGVGPETADSILLYAGHHEVFVVDAYTRRIFERHGLADSKAKYDDIRRMVETALAGADSRRAKLAPPATAFAAPPAVHTPSTMSEAPRSQLAQDYSEFHGLIVQVAKQHCLKAAPRCEGCPLSPFLPK